ncbi:MAG: RsmB/NOP family class I SAM-dependent RNA methyltransferase [Ignavibacteriales bacterium]|nr:RsmB/NOP family class I SAM-dependent RNA methyltransferase [Ignavibacteriales bacterium]
MKNFSQNISDYFLQLYDNKFVADYENYASQEVKTYIRILFKENDKLKLIQNLGKYGIELQHLEEIPSVLLVKNGNDVIGKTIEYILGHYYIQSLSSMLPPILLNPNPTDKVLDLCAAPGSKTTQLADLMNYRGELYSNEVNPKRIRSLINNVERFNLINTAVLFHKGENLCNTYNNYFDKILVDAPCSGLGILNKFEEINKWWSVDHIERLQQLQFHLLVSATKMVKVGGEIIYSTCTMTVEENEELINKIINKYPLELVDIKLPVKSHNGFNNYQDNKFSDELARTKRIIPWEINSEGFFIAKLIKTDQMQKNIHHFERSKITEYLLNSKKKNIVNHLMDLSEYYGIPEQAFQNFKYIVRKNDIYFVNDDWYEDEIQNFYKFGLQLGYLDNHGRANLYYNGVKTLGEYATNNVIYLSNRNELEIFFTGGIIKNINETLGQKIVKYNDYFIGTAVMTKDGLKSQFPKALRSQMIVFPE